MYDLSNYFLIKSQGWRVRDNRKQVDLIILCTYLPKELLEYQKLMPMYFPPSGKNTDAVLLVLYITAIIISL